MLPWAPGSLHLLPPQYSAPGYNYCILTFFLNILLGQHFDDQGCDQGIILKRIQDGGPQIQDLHENNQMSAFKKGLNVYTLCLTIKCWFLRTEVKLQEKLA